jgi:alpha-tubulin suppressor-like RCC1 family protein
VACEKHLNNQLTPIKVNSFNDEKVVMISCGLWHSLALTESSRVFSWGKKVFGQSDYDKSTVNTNSPSLLTFNNNNNSNNISKNDILIEKISCGRERTILLSRDGDIYVIIVVDN